MGISGIFHIFGNEVDGQVHIAGNIAADKVGAGDLGTNPGATSNLTNGDIHYIGSIDHFNKINGDNKLVIFGPDIEYRSYENGDAIQVNFGTKDEPKWQKVDIKHSHIIQTDKPLDIQGELDKLGEKSDNWASQSPTEGVKADFTDHNNSWIDVSEAIKNAGDSKEPIYVTVDASHISGDNKRNITIKGIPAGEELSLSEEDFIRPLPENVVKSTANKVQEQQKEEKATPQTSTSTVVETSTEKEIALPETGEKQNQLISIGAVMSAVAAAILSLGLIIKKKN